ncbi:MAG: hypothetical protein HYZ71_13395 [Deltaproteobacteria bacterium]|nr:hypothetical protein [Deltaproteobacteria bacterium]
MLVRREKFVFQGSYIVEISVHEVARDDRYQDGLKWGLVCVDQKTGKRILMDNHHPKGPHVHVNEFEENYEFLGLNELVADFRRLIVEHLGVEI